ncbi:hypothetical protein [Armatimonas rosea]|uniref:Uncharacterized protein n=1 Tax=Armatimonas rosea TaxID=685828 RepID=A0A7W9SV38_ARMRO|nr:hypothetical protein [Armatimonas rosea]MBB6052913.1 hypothetical protein [Armatimonas rosea]
MDPSFLQPQRANAALFIPKPTLTVGLRHQQTASAELAGLDRRASVNRTTLDAVWLKPGLKQTQNLTLRVDRSTFDFARAANPFEDATQVRLGATFLTPRSKTRSRVVGLSVDSSASARGDFSRGIAGGVILGERHVARPGLTWTYGVALRSQVADTDFLVIPAIGLDWQARQDLRVLFQGQELRATKTLSRTWSLASVTSFDVRRAWRLSDQAAVRDGVVRETSFTSGFEAGYTHRNTTAALILGWQFGRQFQLDDRSGRGVQTIDAGSALTLGLRLSRRL